jgi:hypothetical protein
VVEPGRTPPAIASSYPLGEFADTWSFVCIADKFTLMLPDQDGVALTMSRISRSA